MSYQMFQTAAKAPSGDALEEFMLLNGRYSNFTKETFFLRCASGAGWDQDAARLRTWAGQNGARGCVFTPALSAYLPAPQVEKYVALYQGGQISFPFRFENPIWQQTLERSFDQIVELFQRVRGRRETAIVRNFSVKILCWMDTYFPKLFVETAKMNRFPKFACGGQLKLAEYLFLYLLFLLGCDVLYISPTGEAAVESPELLALSAFVERPPLQAAPEAVPAAVQATPAPGRAVISMDRIRRPERHPQTPPSRPAPPQTPPSSSAGVRPSSPVSIDRPRQPLEFEELAKRASSVVMLKIFDQDGQCVKTGSGVIISDKGYVLTNLHVVSGGYRYGILLEEENDIFYTNELIKYHPDFDLAVLRMDKFRAPIPISRQKKELVRGQKVVAIGSPLGLFNSVSDGIISGFRELEKVSMIQFTAPVSHGSSGGALLDMYGELIGLITGGYNDGQNLNLAVGYRTITQFLGGLL